MSDTPTYNNPCFFSSVCQGADIPDDENKLMLYIQVQRTSEGKDTFLESDGKAFCKKVHATQKWKVRGQASRSP